MLDFDTFFPIILAFSKGPPPCTLFPDRYFLIAEFSFSRGPYISLGDLYLGR